MADDDVFSYVFNDFSFFVFQELWPAGVEVFRVGKDLVTGEELDFEEIDLPLELRNLLLNLIDSLLQGPVLTAKGFYREFVINVGPVDFLHLTLDFMLVRGQGVEELLLFFDDLVGLPEIGGDLRRREEKALELVMEDFFQILDTDLVAALAADVFRGIGGDVHLLPASADGIPGKELDRLLGGPLILFLLVGEDLVALGPELIRDDRLDGGEDPVLLGFMDPFLAVPEALGIVCPVDSLGRQVLEEPGNGGIGKFCALTGAVASFIENPGDYLFPAVFQEELVDEFSNRSLLGVRAEFLVLPLIAEGGLAAGAFTELCPDWDRGGHPLGDLFALPLGHGGDHGIEESPGRGGGVDGFLEGDEIGVVLPEDLGEFQELLGVSGQAGEFREDKAGDVAGADVLQHPLGFGMVDDRFAAHCLQTVDFLDFPLFGLGVVVGALFVVLRAVPPGLVLSGDPDPDAYGLGCLLHCS